jgi:Fic family protein
MPAYQPPFQITSDILTLVADISEQLGRWSALRGNSDETFSPQLRRGNRIRTIQASLAIEHNSLTIEQVTAVLDGKRVLGLPREIQEVHNAFAAYEKMPSWQPYNVSHFLVAHSSLMHGLVDDAGKWRKSGVGVYSDKQLMHMAPPPSQVDRLMTDLLDWLKQMTIHPLVASCVFHYEFEFIHPFSDGNGRMGRLWQTLILSKWKPELAFLPVETVIRHQQTEYYAALSEADKASDATGFVEFMLKALLSAMQEVVMAPSRHQVGTKSVLNSDQRHVLDNIMGEMSLKELMTLLKRTDRTKFKDQILNPLIKAGLVEPTIPDKPTSSKQKYRLKMENS